MEWFRTDVGFTRHKDFVALRIELKVTRAQLAGHMLCLMEAVAEHQEDGRLADVPDFVIEEWADWPNNRVGEFAEALKKTGWVNSESRIMSGWVDRHSKIIADRDRKKEERDFARKSKEDKKKLRELLVLGQSADVTGTSADPERTGSPTVQYSTVTTTTPYTPPSGSVGVSGDQPIKDEHRLILAWNKLATELGLPKAEVLSSKRETSAKARIAEGLLARWDEFASGLRASKWHQGENTNGWKADFDWLCRPDKWRSIVEKAAAPKERPAAPAPEADTFRERVARAVKARVPNGARFTMPFAEGPRRNVEFVATYRGDSCVDADALDGSFELVVALALLIPRSSTDEELALNVATLVKVIA